MGARYDVARYNVSGVWVWISQEEAKDTIDQGSLVGFELI